MQSSRQFRQLRQVVEQQLRLCSSETNVSSLSHKSTENEIAQDQATLHDNVDIAKLLAGVEIRSRKESEGGEGLIFIVRWADDGDPICPKNWNLITRIMATLMVALIAAAVTANSSIESAITTQATELYHVSETAASLLTGIGYIIRDCLRARLTPRIAAMFLFGFGIGSLIAGSFSETFGRNLVYIVSLLIYMLFVMGTGLAPNFGAALILRFLSGFFGSTPLTVAGGTIADIYSPLETAWGFPLFSVLAFSGPLLGPIIGAYIGYSGLGIRWTQWVMLILAGFVFILVLMFQPETYSPLLLEWKASHFRRATNDDRYVAEHEITRDPFLKKLATNSIRPFKFVITELIVLVFALYLVLIYVILFTFFDGYEYIFTNVYGVNQGLTNIIFVAMLCGVIAAGVLVPPVYNWTKQETEDAKATGRSMRPEIRLWYAMLGGSAAIPASLFWVGWTCYPSINIWVPIIGTALFGYGNMCIFTCAYMYIIDVYQQYAASALSFNAFARYIIAGIMTVVGFPMYRNLGPHIACTILGCISAVMVPVPYLLYKFGPAIRIKSKYAVNKTL